MGKQFFAKRKDGKGKNWTGYVGEPLEKFKERMTKKGANIADYEFTDPEGSLTDKGMEILSKIMELIDQLESEITPKGPPMITEIGKVPELSK